MSNETLGSATYSPEDNKLRFYPDSRLSKDDYTRARSAGFIWAPKQELFVAPMWTPEREDLLIEWCGEIGDEDKSLVERAEDRAERFETYSENRAKDAEQAKAIVDGICDGIPLGQPILVGHHSERHARKDAERIENGMRKAIKMWDQSKYWTDRARGAISAAKYKEQPDVRARRIKTIEAAKRKEERYAAQYAHAAKFWNGELKLRNPKTGGVRPFEVNYENAIKFTGSDSCHMSASFPLAEYPRALPASQYEGSMSLYSALGSYDGPDHAIITVDQAKEMALRLCARVADNAARWIAHYDNRLAYERAMLDEGGGLAGEKFNFEVGGRVNVNRWGWQIIVRVNKRNGQTLSLSVAGCSWSIGIEDVKEYKAPAAGDSAKVQAATKVAPLCNYPGVGFIHQTKEEWEKTVPQWSDFPKYVTIAGTETAGKHRVRNQREPGKAWYDHKPVYLTDSKRVDPPAPTSPVKLAPFVPPTATLKSATEPKPAEPQEFDAMRKQLEAGIKVVSAPQLFPTPPELAAQVIEYANISGADRVLEPSAGTGNLLRALTELTEKDDCSGVVAVEINLDLAHSLAAGFPKADIRRGDFLQFNGELGKFDRVIMNPPFANGQDIVHIKHALTFLNPGGRLVAICANGPRQAAELRPLADEWIDLEPDAFKSEGTGVRAAMVVINR